MDSVAYIPGMTFARKLARLSGRRGWNQKTLAEKIGEDTSSVNRWWNGERLPRVDEAWKVARALGVPLDFLADDDRDEPPAAPTESEALLAEMVARLGGPGRTLEILMAFATDQLGRSLPPSRDPLGTRVRSAPPDEPSRNRGAG